MDHTLICRSCNVRVAKTPNKICVNCHAANWGYSEEEANLILYPKAVIDTPEEKPIPSASKNNYTIRCKICDTVVARTPNKICVKCGSLNWGYPADETVTPGEVLSPLPAIKDKALRIILGIVFILSSLLIGFLGIAAVFHGMQYTYVIPPSPIAALQDDQTVIYAENGPHYFLFGMMVVIGSLLLLDKGFHLAVKRSFLNGLFRFPLIASSIFLGLILFLMFVIGDTSSVSTHPDNSGIIKITFLSFLAFAIITFAVNKSSKRPSTSGSAFLLPAVFLLLSFGGLITQLGKITHFSGADEVVDLLRSDSSLQVRNSSSVLFAFSPADERTYMADITPDLFRQMTKAHIDISVPPHKKYSEAAYPGWSPQILLFAFFCTSMILMRMKKKVAFFSDPLHVTTFFSWINTYVIFWLVLFNGPDFGDILGKDIIPGDYSLLRSLIVPGIISWFVFRGTLRNRLYSNLDPVVKQGWLLLFYNISLSIFCGIFLVSNRSAGHPFLVWALCYMTLSAACCFYSMKHVTAKQDA